MSRPAHRSASRRSPTSYVKATLLVAAMVVGSFMLWLGFPIGWLWVGSQFSDAGQPSLLPYVIVLVGFIVSVVIDYKLLVRLNDLHSRVMESSEPVHVRVAWLRSMRDARGRPVSLSVLDVVMIVTVAIAVLAFVVWFFAFAHANPAAA